MSEYGQKAVAVVWKHGQGVSVLAKCGAGLKTRIQRGKRMQRREGRKVVVRTRGTRV